MAKPSVLRWSLVWPGWSLLQTSSGLAEAKAMPPRGLKLNIMSYVCWAQPRSPAARKALPTEVSVMAGQAVAAQSFRARPIRTLD